ncbi:hypothetical protein [Mongoliitalea daihaiensis]|uniref:hypothetical protein n=1 Tax=Mongoliitalea daihaiensis TaxID=2782006 RepID=UPI001F44BF85|nr:hypothetical protein [Mongoliitalea daihaiensis]UJP63991.1 hypothetical protein IPZ59_14330 [Mongoliitalea daihaiensis]
MADGRKLFDLDENGNLVEKNLDEVITDLNNNNLNSSSTSKMFTGALAGTEIPTDTLPVKPRRETVYDYRTPQGATALELDLKSAAENSNRSGKYINVDGEIDDLDFSGFRTGDGKLFGASGMVYLKPMYSEKDGIVEKTSGILGLETLGQMTQNYVNKLDPTTKYRMLIPSLHPETKQPILKEVQGTLKEFQERNIAVTQKYGYQSQEDGFIKSLAKGYLNTIGSTDEVLVSALSFIGRAPGLRGGEFGGLHALHQAMLDRSERENYIASASSSESWTSLDWLGAGLGQALASQTQFGVIGRGANLVSMAALKAIPGGAAKSLAKRKMAENIARIGGSAIVGVGYAHSDARRAGLSDDEAFIFSLTVGALNTLIETTFNVDFDRMMMGMSSKYLSRQLLREVSGNVTDEALRLSAKNLFSAIRAGGSSAFKAAIGEASEEVAQTIVEQSGRTFHDLLFGKDRDVNEGRFEETGFNLGEILEAGFFGAFGTAPFTAMNSIITKKQGDSSFMDKMIFDGDGQTVLEEIKTLRAQGKISDERYAEMYKEVSTKIAAYDTHAQVYANMRGYSRSKELQQEFTTLFGMKAQTEMMRDKELDKLAQNPDQPVNQTFQQAEEAKVKIERYESTLKLINENIAKYKSETYIKERNDAIEKNQQRSAAQRDSDFSRFIEPEVSLSSLHELSKRFTSLTEEERSTTFFARNTTEVEFILNSILSGNFKTFFGDKSDEMLSKISEDLLASRLYLHKSFTSDNYRKLLTETLGISEELIPLNTRELRDSSNNPQNYVGRSMQLREIDDIRKSDAFQQKADEKARSMYGKGLKELDPINRQMVEMMTLVESGRLFGVTETVLHSLNHEDDILSFIENEEKRKALEDMISKSAKPLTFIPGNTPVGDTARGFHEARSGTVFISFSRLRMTDLIVRKHTEGLNKQEADELQRLQDDLFHKLVHEVTHSLFDVAINKMHAAYLRYTQNPKMKSQDALLFERILNLIDLVGTELGNKGKSKDLYFFSKILNDHLSLSPDQRLFQSNTLVKEFFAEALSNKDFQVLLDSYDLNAKKNKNTVKQKYGYERFEKTSVRTVLKEVVDLFKGVFNSFASMFNPDRRTLLSEALESANFIETNKYFVTEPMLSATSSDLSMFNPSVVIDNEDTYYSWEYVPLSIVHRMSELGYKMTESQIRQFEARMEDFVIQELLKDGEDGLSMKTLKIIYFGATDSFLFTWQEKDGDRTVTRRQFFNRYGVKENLNTNTFNPNASSSLKKHHAFADFLPENDNNMESRQAREMTDNFMKAMREGFTGETFLQLNNSKFFGIGENRVQGEVQIVYTFADGTKGVIGFAPDLAKPRLARLLKGNAYIPVNVNRIKGSPGSKAFVIYNEPGNPDSGIKRVLSYKDNEAHEADLLARGFEILDNKGGMGFMPRVEFNYASDRVRVPRENIVAADTIDTITSQDENMRADLSRVLSLDEAQKLNRQYNQDLYESVIEPEFSFYNDLEKRDPFQERIWYVRDKIKNTIRYKAMSGIYSHEQLLNSFLGLVNSSQELFTGSEFSEQQREIARQLGFTGENAQDKFDVFFEDVIGFNSYEQYLKEASKGIRQDWSGEGLNPESTVFGITKAQIEHLHYHNPETGKNQMLEFRDAKNILFQATRNASSYDQMVENMFRLRSDENLTKREQQIAKALHNYYSRPIVNTNALNITDLKGNKVNPIFANEMVKAVAEESDSAVQIRQKLFEIAWKGEFTDINGNKSELSKDEIIRTATALYNYYTAPNANFDGVVSFMGANSLFTAFGSQRRVDSVTMMPNENGGAFVYFNGRKKMKDENHAAILKKIEDTFNRIKAEGIGIEGFRQEVADKYFELTGRQISQEQVFKFFNKIQNFAAPEYQQGKNTLMDSLLKGSGLNDYFMTFATDDMVAEVEDFVHAFYAVLGVEIPRSMTARYPGFSEEALNLTLNQMDSEHQEDLDRYLMDIEIQNKRLQEADPQGFTPVQPDVQLINQMQIEHRNRKNRYAEEIRSKAYTYSTTNFEHKKMFGSKASGNKGDFPTLALLFQNAFFVHSNFFNGLSGKNISSFETAETRRMADTLLFHNTVNQSDEFYFDPKGQKRFSTKVKSGLDQMMEDLSFDKNGRRTRMLTMEAWKRNRVLRTIAKSHGKPIDVIMSGVRNMDQGTTYSESTEVDFAFANLAGFVAYYDYNNQYVHISDIPSDKPTLYGFNLERIASNELEGEITNILTYELEKFKREEKEVRFAFGKDFGSATEPRKLKKPSALNSLIKGVHYETVERNGQTMYLPGRIFNKGLYFYGFPVNETKDASGKTVYDFQTAAKNIASKIRQEAEQHYNEMVSKGLNIPVNDGFVKAKDPRIALQKLESELSRKESYMLSRQENADELVAEVEDLRAAIQKATEELPSALATYGKELEQRKFEIYVNEFYPTYAINRFHLSQLLMGDYGFYKGNDGFSDVNKRMAGPMAPYYRGVWRRPTAKLALFEDVGDRGDKTFSDLPVIRMNDQGRYEIDDSRTNTVAGTRTDAQGYVTEKFAREMTKAYGHFSGFKKVFKPVMFGINEKDLDRAKPLYLKLSTAVILDPNDPKNAAHYEKFPNQLDFARKFYASGADMGLFNSGVKVGITNSNLVTDEQYTTQDFDLDKFGLQNDPEHSVDEEGSTISGGVQIHKQLADNGNFQDMLQFYTIEATILRRQLQKAIEDGSLTSIEAVKAKLIEELGSRAHTSPIAEWLKDNKTNILDHPFTAELAQNLMSSLFNKLGSLPNKPGHKYVNLSDYGYDSIALTETEKAQKKALLEEYFNENQQTHKLKWAGPRTVDELHTVDIDTFRINVKDGVWFVNDVTGIIEDADGQPVIFPADVLVPENAGLPLGTRLISTRIPTTGKASNIPARIVGTIPQELGNVLVSPKEGPAILGFDFDVDGLFTWHHTGGLEKQMDRMFDIAFNVLTHPKNYNEVTTPVSTDTLEDRAIYFSMSEKHAEFFSSLKGKDKKKFASLSDKQKDHYMTLSDEQRETYKPTVDPRHDHWGFARQLQLMKLNSVGKAFIGSSASYFGIYSVFSQTGVRLVDMRSKSFEFFREYNIDGANKGYPLVDSEGKMITDSFVQLINGATDNVKLMVLGRNNINLVTGDVLMDMISHGVTLDYALMFINQPGIRDLVRLTESRSSITSQREDGDNTKILLSIYERLAKKLDPNFQYESVINGPGIVQDFRNISAEKLEEMYLSGNKTKSALEAKSAQDLLDVFASRVTDPNKKAAEALKAIVDQMNIIEKFGYYSGLSRTTRSGGTLATSFSKNPKNFLELKSIKDKIDKAFFSNKPQLSGEIFNHPSYRYQYELFSLMRDMYADNMIVASYFFDGFYSDAMQRMNADEKALFHKHFYNNIIFRNLERNGIDSRLLDGEPLTSIEFNEIFVRIIKDNEHLFAGNKFMSLLTPIVSDQAPKVLASGKGKLSKLEVRVMKDFGETELEEIRQAFEQIPNVEYNGNTVNVKNALVYYMAINKGFNLGGFSMSKIMPKHVVDIAARAIKEVDSDFKFLSRHVKNPISVDNKIEMALRGVGEFLNEGFDHESLYLGDDDYHNAYDFIDMYLNEPMSDFVSMFYQRNMQLLPRMKSSDLINAAKKVSYRNTDEYNQLVTADDNAKYIDGIKITLGPKNETIIEVEEKQLEDNPDLANFINAATAKEGMILMTKEGPKVMFVTREKKAVQFFSNKTQETVEFEREYIRFTEEQSPVFRPDLYEPSMVNSQPSKQYIAPVVEENNVSQSQPQAQTQNTVTKDSLVFIGPDTDLMQIVNAGAVAVTADPAVQEFLVSQGYAVSRKNPDALYPKGRAYDDYTDEQWKTLKNEC